MCTVCTCLNILSCAVRESSEHLGQLDKQGTDNDEAEVVGQHGQDRTIERSLRASTRLEMEWRLVRQSRAQVSVQHFCMVSIVNRLVRQLQNCKMLQQQTREVRAVKDVKSHDCNKEVPDM